MINIFYYFCSALIFLNWIMIWFFPDHPKTEFLLKTKIVPLLIVPIHFWAMATTLKDLPIKIWTFEGLASMNLDPKWILGVWIHMATYDLFVGEWMMRNAKELQITHKRLLPFLIVNFCHGMFGFGLYMMFRNRLSQKPK